MIQTCRLKKQQLKTKIGPKKGYCSLQSVLKPIFFKADVSTARFDCGDEYPEFLDDYPSEPPTPDFLGKLKTLF